MNCSKKSSKSRNWQMFLLSGNNAIKYFCFHLNIKLVFNALVSLLLQVILYSFAMMVTMNSLLLRKNKLFFIIGRKCLVYYISLNGKSEQIWPFQESSL